VDEESTTWAAKKEAKTLRFDGARPSNKQGTTASVRFETADRLALGRVVFIRPDQPAADSAVGRLRAQRGPAIEDASLIDS
jgi:hypothetical protein